MRAIQSSQGGDGMRKQLDRGGVRHGRGRSGWSGSYQKTDDLPIVVRSHSIPMGERGRKERKWMRERESIMNCLDPIGHHSHAMNDQNEDSEC